MYVNETKNISKVVVTIIVAIAFIWLLIIDYEGCITF